MQRPYTERVSLEDRARQIRSASREATRVNPASQQRGYAIDGYEEHSYIDEGRSLDQPLPRGAKTGKVSQSLNAHLSFVLPHAPPSVRPAGPRPEPR